MIPRGKKVPIILLGIMLLGLYLYKMADFHQSVPLYITKRLSELNRKLEDSNYYRKNESIAQIEAGKYFFSSKSTAEIFKTSLKCLGSAKLNIAQYFQETYDMENLKNFDTKIEPICNQRYTLIILVTTRPSAYINRAAIRMSWGRMDSSMNKQVKKDHPGLTWLTLFSVGLVNSPSLGSLVALESEQYKDILRLPYVDSYKNLPNKTMNSLEWIANNCNAEFVLKTDDDCFVNVFHMLKWLDSLPPNHEYMGRVNIDMPVIRDPRHRNYVPKREHADEFYKPYCAGGGYILRGTILKNVTKMGKKIKQIINEDAYMGMLTNALGIVPRNDERFLPFIFLSTTSKKSNMCNWRDKFLVHNVFVKRQLIMHYNSIAMTYFQSLCEKF